MLIGRWMGNLLSGQNMCLSLEPFCRGISLQYAYMTEYCSKVSSNEFDSTKRMLVQGMNLYNPFQNQNFSRDNCLCFCIFICSYYVFLPWVLKVIMKKVVFKGVRTIQRDLRLRI